MIAVYTPPKNSVKAEEQMAMRYFTYFYLLVMKKAHPTYSEERIFGFFKKWD